MLENGLKVEYNTDGNAKTGPMDNTFVVCQWPTKIYSLVEAILSGDVDKVGKNNDFTPPQKVTHFRNLTNTLMDSEKISLLTSVIRGRRTMKEMSEEAVILRRVKKIQKYIMKDLKVEDGDWEACRERYGPGCTSEALDCWINTVKDFRQIPYRRPVGWESYIESLKLAGAAEVIGPTTETSRTFTFEGLKYTFHHGDVCNLYTLLGRTKGDYGKYYFGLPGWS